MCLLNIAEATIRTFEMWQNCSIYIMKTGWKIIYILKYVPISYSNAHRAASDTFGRRIDQVRICRGHLYAHWIRKENSNCCEAESQELPRSIKFKETVKNMLYQAAYVQTKCFLFISLSTWSKPAPLSLIVTSSRDGENIKMQTPNCSGLAGSSFKCKLFLS